MRRQPRCTSHSTAAARFLGPSSTHGRFNGVVRRRPISSPSLATDDGERAFGIPPQAPPSASRSSAAPTFTDTFPKLHLIATCLQQLVLTEAAAFVVGCRGDGGGFPKEASVRCHQRPGRWRSGLLFRSPQHRNTATPQHRNTATPQHRNTERRQGQPSCRSRGHVDLGQHHRCVPFPYRGGNGSGPWSGDDRRRK